jgi:hypothetical protein
MSVAKKVDFKGIGLGLVKGLSRNLRWRAKENHETCPLDHFIDSFWRAGPHCGKYDTWYSDVQPRMMNED